MDASPRGGDAGFVKVLDPQTLLIPDSPGNNRLDSLSNILATSQIGLLFFVPGIDEVVRLNGRATIQTDVELLKHFQEMTIGIAGRHAQALFAGTLKRQSTGEK